MLLAWLGLGVLLAWLGLGVLLAWLGLGVRLALLVLGMVGAGLATTCLPSFDVARVLGVEGV